MLYVPGNNLKLIEKALNLNMDAVILDLEDAVPMADKETARSNVRESIALFKATGVYVFVRVNSLETGLTEDDLHVVVADGLDGIMLAKAEIDINKVDAMLSTCETKSGLKAGDIKVVPLVESALGVINSYALVTSTPRIEAIAFGAGDYLRDLGGDITTVSDEQTELLYARSHIVNCCKAARVQAIDTPYLTSLKDTDRFLNEVKIAKTLGFSGKQCIHPNQITPVNESFSPLPEKVAYSIRLVAAFEEAEKQGMGAVSFEGKMIDRMSYLQAKELLARNDAIVQREKKSPM